MTTTQSNIYPETQKKLRLYEISMEPALQTRVEMNPKKVSDYQQAYKNGAIFPPVLVATHIGKHELPVYRLLDGWHRIQALLNNRVTNTHKIEVKLIEVPQDITIHTLRYLGGKENIKNGLGLTSKDKRVLFRAYVKGRCHREGCRYKSYREIANELSLVSHQTLARWMLSDFPSVARAMGKHSEDSEQLGAQGTGMRLIDMPNLTDRERDIFFESLIAEAKSSDNNRRRIIAQWAQNVVSALEVEAPFELEPLKADDMDAF